jgi:FkbM family methyltransferase
MAIECVVIDAGARYGLHPTWAELRGAATFHLFEMDGDEASRLSTKYQSDDRITIYPLALYREDTTLTFTVRTHKALNSLFHSNDKLLETNDYMQDEFSATTQKSVEARSIDSLFAGQDVHFMKLDTEGAELDVLHGAQDTLATSVLGVRSEVLFAPLYVNAPLFGDIHNLLSEQGLELLNLDYSGAGNRAGKFTMPGRYGKLMSTDAVWVVSNDRLFSAKGERLLHDVVRFGLFLFNNGATDLAVETLLGAVRDHAVDLTAVEDDPLLRALHKKSLLLFKSLLSLPMLDDDEVTGTYSAIFGKEFPTMNKFFESDLFQ